MGGLQGTGLHLFALLFLSEARVLFYMCEAGVAHEELGIFT
jgi:hypothetical protein